MTVEEVNRSCGVTFDTRLLKPGMIFAALKSEKADGHDFIPHALAKGAVGVIDGLDELKRLANEKRRQMKATVIGVTGSAGKTTTKELLKAFFAQLGRVSATAGNFNNEIGLPLTILNADPMCDFLVVEMGTNHPGEIARLCAIAEPDCGVITSIGTAHIENFGAIEATAREKGTLLAAAHRLNVVLTTCACHDILVGLAAGRLLEPSPTLPAPLAAALAEVLPGAHNVANAAVAYAAAREFGLTLEQACAALKGFELPGSRFRRTTVAGVTYIDDTYNANPDAMKAALTTFAALPTAGRRIALLGEMFELGAQSATLHREVMETAQRLKLDAVYGIGPHAALGPCTRGFPTVDACAAFRESLVRPGDLVLLKASHALHLNTLIPSVENH